MSRIKYTEIHATRWECTDGTITGAHNTKKGSHTAWLTKRQKYDIDQAKAANPDERLAGYTPVVGLPIESRMERKAVSMKEKLALFYDKIAPAQPYMMSMSSKVVDHTSGLK